MDAYGYNRPVHPGIHAREKARRADALATARAERAEAFFAMWVDMPPAQRSYEALMVTLRRVGMAVSAKTLRQLSRENGWLDRAAVLDSERALETQKASAVGVIAAMNARQAAQGRALGELGARAARKLGPRVLEIGPGDAARLVEVGQRVERLAMGEATTRAEVLVTTYSRLVVEVWELFAGLNDLDDRDDRRKRFALGVDTIVDRYLAAGGNPAPVPALSPEPGDADEPGDEPGDGGSEPAPA